ncbi:protein unc-80 homolog isoform X2 [Ciona intestinalis]
MEFRADYTNMEQHESKPDRTPLPIQSFLWRQTDPFLRRKIGKLYEASCASFEHILVDNKLQGLPPSLSGAIGSITRWQLIDICLPHVMHCAAIFLINRNKLGQADKLGVPGTKLLHTLHWIFLESQKACSAGGKGGDEQYSVTFGNVQLFIYLFAPIINNIRETDLVFRLDSGQLIWRSMWSYEQPNIPAFSRIIPSLKVKNEPAESRTLFSGCDIPGIRYGKMDEAKEKVLFSSVCDVAVVNCLLFQRWSEDGILWGMTYILKKLQKLRKATNLTLGRTSHRRCVSMNAKKTSMRKYRPPRKLSPQQEIPGSECDRSSSSMANIREAKKVHMAPDDLSPDEPKRTSLFGIFRTTAANKSMRHVLASPIQKRKSAIRRMVSSNRRRSVPTFATKTSLKALFSAAEEAKGPNIITIKPKDILGVPSTSMQRNSIGSTLEVQKSTSCFRDVDMSIGLSKTNSKELFEGKTVCADVLDEGKTTNGERTSQEETNNQNGISSSDTVKQSRRWTSDTCLAYVPPTLNKSSSEYDNEDGCIRVEVLLSVVDSVISKGPGLRVIDVCLQVLEHVVQMKMLPEPEDSDITEDDLNIDYKHQNTVGVFLRVLYSLIKLVGCSNGCHRSGHRSAAADRIRATTQAMMGDIFSNHRKYFRVFIKNVVKTNTVAEIMDFLHPLLAYCNIDINTCDVLDINGEQINHDAESKNNLHNMIVKVVFGDLMRKLLDSKLFQDNFTKQTNRKLYDEVRHFVQFVRLKNPSTFNQVLLSTMLLPLRKRKAWIKDQKTLIEKETKQTSTTPDPSSVPMSRKMQRRGGVVLQLSPIASRSFPTGSISSKQTFFRKYKESSRLSSAESSSLLPRLSTCDHVGNSSDEEEDEDDVYRNARSGSIFKIPIKNPFKNKSGEKSPYSPSSTDEKRFSEFVSNDGNGTTLLSRIMMKTMQKKQEAEFQNSEAGLASMAQELNEKGTFPDEKLNDFVIDTEDIYIGVCIFDFLLECCPPGTVPEHTVIGSVLGLESSVLSRATILLQLACFIKRCSIGDWPSFMQNKGKPSKFIAKNAKFYVAAAKQFYKWGEAISEYLEKVVSVDNNPSVVLGNITDHDDQMKNRHQDFTEDYLKDVMINPSGKDCPTPLKMAATNLLLQITAFLRDVYPRLPQYDYDEQATRDKDGCSLTATPPCKKSIKFQNLVVASCTHGSTEEKVRRISILHGNRDSSSESISSRISRQQTPNTVSESPVRTRSFVAATTSNTSNTLTVPNSNVLFGGSFSPFSSTYSIGSTNSVGDGMCSSDHISSRDIAPTSSITSCSVLNLTNSGQGSSSWIDNLPWLKVTMTLANQHNFICDHLIFCHPYCHKRLHRSCTKLVGSLYDAIAKNQKSTECGEEPKRCIPFLSYLKSQASCLTKSPLAVLLKSVSILSNDTLINIQALTWELLLDGSKEIVEIAGALFLLCAIKIPQEVHTSIMMELTNTNTTQRLTAIKKIGVLWECRNAVWRHAETKARAVFRTHATSLNCTLSMATLGLEASSIPDPPWMPHIIDMDKILAQNSSSVQSAAFLATDTLSHYKEKQLEKLLRLEDEKLAKARCNFHLTDVPVAQSICNELKKKAANEELEEGNEQGCVNRRLSSRLLSVGSSSSNSDQRKEDKLPNRASSFFKSQLNDGSQDNTARILEYTASLPNYSVFPSSVAVCIPEVIRAMEDICTTKDDESVGDAARCVVLTCLKEDPHLFLRNITEKLGDKKSRFSSMWFLKKLSHLVQYLSPNVAHVILSNLIEVILQQNRFTPTGSPIITQCLLAITNILPFAEAIDLKTLKLALRKEQIDTQVLVTAGLPGTKKITIWNQDDYYMPNQVDVTDNTTFEVVLREALALVEVSESENRFYQLLDPRENEILCRHCYVRDFYPFRKSVYPQLTLVRMEQNESTPIMASKVVHLKLAEISKLCLSLTALRSQRNPVDRELNATFVQDELKKLWSFPKKAMDAEFFLFDTEYGEVIKHLDIIQKCYWIDLVRTILLSLPREYPWNDDLIYLMHVLSSALVIHCEAAPLLRKYTASIIDIVVYFSHSFTLQGYSLILPTMLRVYSKHYSNKSVRNCLELVFKQMYQVHRKPFLLQLFACAAPLLSEYNWLKVVDCNDQDQVSHHNFFQVLLALENPEQIDDLQVMSLVQASKPLKPVDECLNSEDDTICFIDYFRLCITVIAYQPENSRTLEMLIVLNSILPCYYQHIQNTFSPVAERAQIFEIAVCIRSLLASVEALTRTLNCTSQQQQQFKVIYRQASEQNLVQQPQESVMADEENETSTERNQPTEEFIAQRDVMLQLCTTFYTRSKLRMQKLKRCTQTDELLNTKSHLRIADIAHSLLKLLTDETVPTVSTGLASYVQHMLPVVDWSVEAIRPALFLVLKRLDRFFGKISKVYTLRSGLDWRTVSPIVSGLCQLLSRQPAVAHVPHLKSLVTFSAAAQAGESSCATLTDPTITCQCNAKLNISPTLTTNIVNLMVYQIQGLSDATNLESLIRPLLTSEKNEILFLNLIIPICLCAAADSTVVTRLNKTQIQGGWKRQIDQSDVMFIIDLCLNTLRGSSNPGKPKLRQLFTGTSPLPSRQKFLSYHVAWLTLRVAIACFQSQLQTKWYSIAYSLKQIVTSNEGNLRDDKGSSSMIAFLLFSIRFKTPLILYLRSFIEQKVDTIKVKTPEEVERRNAIQNILADPHPGLYPLSSFVQDIVVEIREVKRRLQCGKLNTTPNTPNTGLPFPSRTLKPTKDRTRVNSFRFAVSSGSHKVQVEKEESVTSIVDTQRTSGQKKFSKGRDSWKKLSRAATESYHNQSSSATASIDDHGFGSRHSSLNTSSLRSGATAAAVPNIKVDHCQSPGTSRHITKEANREGYFYKTPCASGECTKDTQANTAKLVICDENVKKPKRGKSFYKSKHQQQVSETNNPTTKQGQDFDLASFERAKQALSKMITANSPPASRSQSPDQR